MSIRYLLRVRRRQEDERIRNQFNNPFKYPHLVQSFSHDEDLKKLSESELKDFLQHKLKSSSGKLNMDLEVEKTEYVSLVYFEKGGGVVWEGDLELPKKVVRRINNG